MESADDLFKGRHFDRGIIILCVRWYLRFKLSFRDLVEMMAERGLFLAALSHWQIEHITNLPARRAHAAATTSRHVCTADARKARCVLAEVRWRRTLKVLYVAAWIERNLCADPTLLNPSIFLSLRRVG